MNRNILLAWSGGKDSTMTLYQLQEQSNFQIAALLTTVTEDYDRIAIHGVRQALLDQQAQSLGILVHKIYLSKNSSNEEYEAKMEKALLQYKAKGIESIAFGDIFLEDVREYREMSLTKVGVDGLFPIWKRDTDQLVRAFIELGFQAILTCVDSKVLAPTFAGRVIDERFLEDLPDGVDPCGENGEFHSFVYDGPIFRGQVAFEVGETVMRDSFCFCDLVPL